MVPRSENHVRLGILLVFLPIASILAVASSTGGQERATDDSWIEMFNGKDLAGWVVNEAKDSVRVEDGALVTNGPRAHAFFVGADGKADFTNFEFQAEVKTEKNANSGIYFHTKFLEEGWPDKGYEAQVNNTHSDPKKTGGLYAVKDNFHTPVEDGEWFLYEIRVKGRTIELKINGQTITEYTEEENLNRPERQLDHGTIALQAHDPGSKVY
ncbi:MAG: DUF1080 domain-containing protein, partial [Planctomycetales bacterium]|nr:DUF1080 domain-containing protein [Planctomycetales bacterium]